VRDLESLVSSLRQPRMVIVLVQAGDATDTVIDSLAELLAEGDVIVDAGNGHFADTRRRAQHLAQTGLHFVGAGVSGGGQGALLGPSIMAGGSATSYEIAGPLLETISASVGDEPCCARVGPDGADHFVKMVHNGIEYAVMQLLAEVYDVMRHRLGFTPAVIGEVFSEWATSDLGSFLVETTAQVLGHTDEFSGRPFVDVVVDQAGQKGTGRWSVQTALDLGVPATAIAEAMLARALSSSLAQREASRESFTGGALDAGPVDPDDPVEDVRRALYAATLVAYSQGFEIIAAAGREYDWDIDHAEVARIWRGGCIIRARLLDTVMASFQRDPALPLLLAADEFATSLAACMPAWRRLVADAALTGVSLPALASSLFS
jgi:6-phosphogluconate dehydrogenase